MQRGINLLAVALLAVIVVMTCVQERDILSLKERAARNEWDVNTAKAWAYGNHDRLKIIEGGLTSDEGGLESAEGGLVPSAGGLDLYRARAAVVMLSAKVRKQSALDVIIGRDGSQTSYSYGTGTFMSDNTIITAAHVLEGFTELSDVEIKNEAGQTFTATSVTFDTADDLAVIQTSEKSRYWLEPDFETFRPELGEVVIGIGVQRSDIRRELIIYWAHVSRRFSGSDFVFDGFAWHGNSGGPILAGGKIAGVCRARRTGTCGLGYATAMFYLDKDLR